MPKILVLYYSHTGNTEKMAKGIVEGVRKVKDVEVEMKRSESPWGLAHFDAIVIGAPTYGHNMSNNIKNFLEEIAFHEVALKDKIGAVFGSYGWSGEAPRLVLEVMKNKFEMQVIEPPLLIKYAPNPAGLEKCREFGGKIARQIVEKAK